MSHALPPPGQGSSVSNAVEAASAGSKLSKIRSATARARRSSLTRRIMWAALFGGRPSSMPSRILQTRSDGERQIGQAQMPAGTGPPRRTHAAAGRWEPPADARDATERRVRRKKNARQRKKIKE